MDDADKPIAIGTFQINCTLTDKRVVVVSGHILASDTQHDLDKRLDFYQDVLDRQVTRCDVQNKEAQVASLMAGIEQHNELYQELVQRKAKGGRLTTQENERINKFELERGGAVRQLESTRSAIAIGRRKLNGAA